MRTYSQVTEITPPLAEFFSRHRDRLLGTAPRGAWVCEDDGQPIIALLVFTEPRLRVSVIMDEPNKKQFNSLSKLAQTFESWATDAGIEHYGVVINENDHHYAKIIERRGALELGRANGWVEYLHQINQKPNLEPGIRPWEPADWKLLRPLMRQFLNEQAKQGGDFLPTRNNVEAFIRRGVRAASKGDPCLLMIQDSTVVGFTLWTGLDTDLDVRERICHGAGTFVLPDLRRQGIATRLREAALAAAKTAGYDSVNGTTFSRDALASARAANFKAAGAYVRQRIPQE